MAKILITGGHLAPALAVIEELKKTKKNIEIIFVGRKYALDSEKTISLEYKEITKLKIPFISLTAGRLTRVLTLRSLRNFLRLPIGFFNAFFIVRDQKPDVVLSFGSYLAVPIVFWAYLFKIPSFSHEQTIRPGLANRIISLFAKKIFVAFPEAKHYFNPGKTLITGNPVRKSIFIVKKIPFPIAPGFPVIYITGGSLGSHSINEHIKKIIPKLVHDFIVIHQVGETKEYGDYEGLLKIKQSLPRGFQNRYFLSKHFFEDEIGYIYSRSDLIVGRAGANTFFELIALQKPAIFIPLPWSAGREQQRHAEIFARAGCGEIFHQVEPSTKLLRLINSMIKNIDLYKKNFGQLSIQNPTDGDKKIAAAVLT